jgi:hypothetical protein
MTIYYYLSVFPTEGLVASQLVPEDFSSYMAVGSKKGHKENLIFIEVREEFGDYFDWAYAKANCVPHRDGRPKHSVYLAVYRVLENVPLHMMGSLYLVTRDGKSLELTQCAFENPRQDLEYYAYQELCPVRPLVVSTLNPRQFAEYLTSGDEKIYLPRIIFADLKMIDFTDLEYTGNIGCTYDGKIEHLKDCIDAVTSEQNKVTKTLDRSHVESFTYQAIKTGVYVSDRDNVCMYPMKTLDQLKEHHYYWAKSALIL